MMNTMKRTGNYTIGAAGAAIFLISMVAWLSALTHANPTTLLAAPNFMVAPQTKLDTSTIDDLRGDYLAVANVPVEDQDALDGYLAFDCDCYVFPMGAEINVAGGFYWADVDGLYWCPADSDMCTGVAAPLATQAA